MSQPEYFDQSLPLLEVQRLSVLKQCARPWMGGLEVANLPEAIGYRWAPLFKECRFQKMFCEERRQPPAPWTFSAPLAEPFDLVAQELSHA